MKPMSLIKAVLLIAVALLSSLSGVNAQVIYEEGFTTNSTVMSSNPASPTATSTDYAVLAAKDATGSTLLDLTIPATSSGLAEMQALFTDTPVTLADGETLRLKITFQNTHLLDGGGSSPGSQLISFGLFNSGGSYPVPGGQMANGQLTDAGHGGTNFPSGYATGWQGFVGKIANPSQSSVILTRDDQSAGSDNEVQDTLFADGITGGYDTPDGTDINASLPEITIADGVYTMVLDVTKSGGGMTIDQYLYEGTAGALVYSASGTTFAYIYDTFDALSFGFRGRNTDSEAIHMDVSSLVVSKVNLLLPSVSGLGDTSVLASQNLTLAPVISGEAPLFIQWSSNAVALAGETNDTLVLNNIQLAQSGTVYSVVVSNTYGSASDSMTLSVTPAPPSTGLYNLQLNTGDGSAAYTGAAQIGSTGDLWNNPVWDGVASGSTTLFSEFIVDSGGANGYGVSATLTATYNDNLGWNGGGTFNSYSSRLDGGANPVFMTKVVKLDNKPDINTLTLSFSNLPTNTACSLYMYGSGNKAESGYYCSLDAANGGATGYIVYDTNSVYAATGRDVTTNTSQGLSWQLLAGTSDASGDLTVTITSPGYGNAQNQIFINGLQLQVDLPVTAPTEDPVITSIAVSGTDVTLSWTAQDLGTYSVLRKANLDDPTWSTVVSNLPSGNLTTNFTDVAGQSFYKVYGE